LTRERKGIKYIIAVRERAVKKGLTKNRKWNKLKSPSAQKG
jgi:hypothetical protein